MEHENVAEDEKHEQSVGKYMFGELQIYFLRNRFINHFFIKNIPCCVIAQVFLVRAEPYRYTPTNTKKIN
jgi:hypothetical protein